MPDSSAIAFGNADKYLRATLYDAFVNDDWRISPGFTLNIGMRWEYNSPVTELYGRLVNLDVQPGYTAVAPVVANSPTGSLTGQNYPDSLVKPDKTAFQPRLAIVMAAAARIVVSGSGRIRHVLQHVRLSDDRATRWCSKRRLSKSFNIANSLANPLTLANGFTPPAGTVLNTFAIDPNFRVGYTHTWQVSVQRDLPQALIMTATYLGIKGTRGTQEFLPNTYPIWRIEPLSDLSQWIRFPGLERQFNTRSGPDSSCAAPAQWIPSVSSIHLCKSDSTTQRWAETAEVAR